jgi:rRNA-processing protein FCF1
MFFKYNTQLGPPYQVLVDTNFINFSIKNKVRRSSLTGCSAAPAIV